MDSWSHKNERNKEKWDRVFTSRVVPTEQQITKVSL